MSASLRIAALALGASLSAQGFNCQLHSTVNPLTGATSSKNNYAGMWGTVLNGRELAILPARSGTFVYDCTNPAAPVLLGSVAGPAPSTGTYWREASSRGNYAYIASEHGSLQAINIGAGAPTLAGTFGSRAHSLQVDLETSRLWANGGAINGSRIYDLSANAISPPLATSYTSAYVHDCFPSKGYAYMAQINAGNFRILDTSAFPTLTVLSTTSTPGNFTHNCWTNREATVLATCDENSGGCLAFYDVTFKTLPILLSTWCSPAGATVHNVFVKDRVAHLSSYTAGYYAVDISEPANPRLIASYDTNVRTGAGYTGCWGCFPLQPSGAVYLADMENGLFVVEATCGVPKSYGNGTAGTGGKTPIVEYGGGFAQVGRASFKLEGDEILANAPVAMFIAAGPAAIPFFGIDVNVDLGGPFVQVSGFANAQGKVSFNVPIGAGTAGATIYVQMVSLDANGPQGLAASRGFTVKVCQ